MTSFKFKTEWLEQLRLLSMGASSEDMTALFAALYAVSNGEEPGDLSPFAQAVYNQIASEIVHGKKISDTRAENGSKGGKQTSSKRKQTEATAKQNEANGSKEREKKEEKKEVSPTPPLESKEVSKEKEGTARSVDNTNVLSPSLACAEPEKSASTPEPEPLITLPLNDGSEFPVFTDMVSEFSALYPAVNVMQELRNMRGWILGKPERRKTKRGIRAFITTWLSKEQDRGPRQVARSGTTQRRLTPGEVAALPAIDPFAILNE